MRDGDFFEMPATAEIRLNELLRAASDPRRLKMLIRLGDDAYHACQVEEFGMDELQKSALSHHFRMLREAGFTRTRKAGRSREMQLRRDELDARFPGLLDALLSPQAVADAAEERA